ncbi:Uma2 family endonuclease [Pseudonocardia nigra]|uniref:Uma2 family endonuclease n=1 Tax=Pseudonocardia nigra TaxID=1921578 RepID=UPI001C60147F|nr:Uma2 family endonuclease [Pseudonocardia nigra]
MRVLMLDAPQSMLDERRRLGQDVRDEMWDGVLHMVPPPSDAHQEFAIRFLFVIVPIAEGRGLLARYETGLFRADKDYRVPDQLYCRPEQRSDRGAEGAELVVEIRSPGDETYDKIDFYSRVGVREMVVVHPHDRRVELFRALGGRLVPVQPGPDGSLASEVLGISLCTVEGTLRVTWADGTADI